MIVWLALALLSQGSDQAQPRAGGSTAKPAAVAMPKLACGPMAVRAEERDRFEEWVDSLAGMLIPDEHGRAKSPPALRNEAIAALEKAIVDWQSFQIEGEKNLEFPQMFYRIEFHEFPMYLLHPGNLWRQIAKRPAEAARALPDGGAANSSFFTNTAIDSYTPLRMTEEFAIVRPIPPLQITKIKKTRTTEGIWVKDARGRTYIVLFDSPFAPEMSTSAEYIGSTLCRMAGYNVPRVCITTVEGTGNPMYDGRRAVATLALKNYKGEYRYASFRDRREIRGLLIFGAWVGNVDLTEQNTGMTIDKGGACRHYVFDFGASLGSFTFRPQMARLGWTRLFDPYQQFTQPLYDLGIRRVPWEAPYKIQAASIGYFTDNFDPDQWQPFYRNMAFLEVTERDKRWMAERIARFSDEQIKTVVGLAGYTHANDRDYIAAVLISRRNKIAMRYLR